MNSPEYVKVDDELYKINTDFRVAIECDKIAKDKSIGDYERALAIIYKLFGEEGLSCPNQNKLFQLAMKYISLGRDENPMKNNSNDKFELDIHKCEGLIKSSFKFDYNYDPYELPYLHWYKFYNDLKNLSTSEFGTCCVLNRTISVLNQDASKIKDNKDRQNLLKTQKYLKEEYCVVEEKTRTKEEEESAEAFLSALGFKTD